MGDALGGMLLLLVLTIVLRRRWLATVAFCVIAIGLLAFSPVSPLVIVPSGVLVALVATRYGMLAMLSNTLFASTTVWPLTLDLNAFYFASSLIPIALLLGLAWCALYITLGGKPLGGWTERGNL